MRAGPRGSPTSSRRRCRSSGARREAIAPRATDLIDEWLAEGVAAGVDRGAVPRELRAAARAGARARPRAAGHGRGRRELPAPHRRAERARLPAARVRGRRRQPARAAATSREVARRPNRTHHGQGDRRDAQPPALDAVDVARAGRRARTRPTPNGCTCSPTTSTGWASSSTVGDAAALLRSIRDDVGLGTAMGTLDNSGRGRDSSHLDDVTALLAIAAVHPDPATFEIWLREHLQGVTVGDDPRGAGQVTLSTVHRVKGLEWERVIVLGAHDGPHAPSPHRRHRGRTAGLPRRAHPLPRRRWCCSPTPARPRRSSTSSRPSPRRCSRSCPRTRPGSNGRGAPRRRAASCSRAAAESSPLDRGAARVAARALPGRRRARLRRAPRLDDQRDRVGATARSDRELARITGIGPTKLERYGDDILEIVDAQ